MSAISLKILLPDFLFKKVPCRRVVYLTLYEATYRQGSARYARLKG